MRHLGEMTVLRPGSNISRHFGGGGLAAKLCATLATPRTVACQAPLSVGFSRQQLE